MFFGSMEVKHYDVILVGEGGLEIFSRTVYHGELREMTKRY